MSKMIHLIDLREPPTDLPALEYNLTDADKANAKVDMAILRAQRIERNERDMRKQG